jgi:DNA-binding transcriptional ArsR family regulator
MSGGGNVPAVAGIEVRAAVTADLPQIAAVALAGGQDEEWAGADPRRRQMLELVWDREQSPSDLARRYRLSRPATSQHLKVLREADLVSVRLQGNRRFYRVRADRLAELRAMLDEFWMAASPASARRASMSSSSGPAAWSSRGAGPIRASGCRLVPRR